MNCLMRIAQGHAMCDLYKPGKTTALPSLHNSDNRLFTIAKKLFIISYAWPVPTVDRFIFLFL